MRGWRIGEAAFVVVVALLLGAAPAEAVVPTSCASLSSDVNAASAGEVLQLPPGPCAVNLVVTNTNAFTLEGATAGGATTLEPSDPTQAIIDSNADVRFTLTGLTLTGTTNNAAVSLHGAGTAATFRGNTFLGNTWNSSSGAAISIQNLTAPTTTQPTVIVDNKFISNSSDNLGGAIAELNLALPLVISGNTFTANRVTAGGFAGGAIGISNTPTIAGTGAVQISGNTFGGQTPAAGNTSPGPGGAVYILMTHGRALTLSGNTFESNRITGVDNSVADLREGGAVYLTPASNDTQFPVFQSHNAFIGNVIDATAGPMAPPGLGGAAEWALGEIVNSVGDVFTGNRVAAGGSGPAEGGAVGVIASAANGSVAAQPAGFIGSDDLFDGNSTVNGGWGGAIYSGIPLGACSGTCPPSTVVLNDSTVVGNRVDAGAGSEGGAIWGSPHDHLTLRNSIVFGDSPRPELFGFSAAPPTIQFSDVCHESGGPGVPAHAGNICLNPRLGGNGVETALSPTLDAGSNALVPAGLTTDILGHPRIRSCGVVGPKVVDMGAYEFASLGQVPGCLDRTNPVVVIGRGPLRKSHGGTFVRLTCPRGQSFCDGSVTLVRARGGHRLGRRHFDILGGRSTTVRVGLLSTLGSSGSVRVVVQVVARDRRGRRGRSHRAVTLRL